MGTSLIHSCASLVWWRGIWLPWESHSHSRRLPALVWISWADITFCQHHLRSSQCFVLIKQSDSPCPLQFWVECSSHKESLEKHSLSINCHQTWILSTPRSVKQLPSSSNLKTRTLAHTPQRQSFSRSYGSILPASLTHFILWTRGCYLWRPGAVMGTIRSANKSVFRLFNGSWKRIGHLEWQGAIPAD